ncbi:MAG: hypothetical protein DRG32_02970 [Deltaproteobacteria bacterium]|nr:MAG: hypothetical protein DRG32_02970 [Deltaproteobacteria bacterium]
MFETRNHVLLHQTIVGLEVKEQLELRGAYSAAEGVHAYDQDFSGSLEDHALPQEEIERALKELPPRP